MLYFNWISTASFIALNKRVVKNDVFQLHYWQYKMDTASFVFQLGRISHSEKNKGRLHRAFEAKV